MNKKINIIILFLFLISLSLIFIDTYNGNTGLTTDGTCYMQVAKNLFQGNGYTLAGEKHTVFPPGYPILIGIFAIIMRNYLLSAQFISILAFIGASLILYDILRKNLKNKTLIILFMTIFLFNQSLLRLSNLSLSDLLYVFLMIINIKLLFLIVKDKKNNYKKYFIYLGLVNGYMYLTRPEGCMIFIINLIFLLFLMLKHVVKINSLLFMLFPFLVLSFPYIYFLHSATNKWQVSGKSMNFIQNEVVENPNNKYLWEKTGYKLLEDGRNVMISSAASSDFNPIKYILSNKKNIIKRIYINMLSYIKTVGVTFGLLSIFLIFVFKPQKNYIIIYLTLLILSSLYLLIFNIGRYWISYMPIFLVLLALITDYLTENKIIKNYIVIIFLLTGLFLNFYTGQNIFKQIFQKKDQFKIEKIAANWINENIPKDNIFLVRKPFIPFLSKHEWLRIPWFTESSDFVDYMKRNDLKYFIISKDERSRRPFLRNDEKNGNLLKYAEVVKKFSDEGNNVKVMKIK